MNDYIQTRIHRTQERLQKLGCVAAVATSPANFFYYTEQWIEPHERLLAMVIPSTGHPVLLAPKLHEEELSSLPFEVVLWEDAADPVALLAKHLPTSGTVCIDNNWPSHFLMTLMKHRPSLSFGYGSDVFAHLRRRKDAYEIGQLKAAGAKTDQVMRQLIQRLQVGMSEQEIVLELTELWRKAGVHELSFAPIIARGPNGARPHHQPGQDVLREGDTVIIDMGGLVNRYCSDITRTVVMQQVSDDVASVYQIVRTAQEQAAKMVQPGIAIGEIDRTARDIIRDAGYGAYFNNRVGHGLGLEIHEEPFAHAGNDLVLEEGMVFSVEPGIYLPGQFGVRIEDVVVVTDTGSFSLYQFTKDLLVVG